MVQKKVPNFIICFYVHNFYCYCFQIGNFIFLKIQYEYTVFVTSCCVSSSKRNYTHNKKIMPLCMASICNNTNGEKSPRRVDKSPDPDLSGGLSGLLKPFYWRYVAPR